MGHVVGKKGASRKHNSTRCGWAYRQPAAGGCRQEMSVLCFATGSEIVVLSTDSGTSGREVGAAAGHS
jgi:hypothetical protein